MGLTERELCADAVQWFALTVRHQHERQTERQLQLKGYETLVPFYRTQRTWSDRIKQIELPLFAGYIFCRFPAAERVRVLNTPGVAGVVAFAGQAAPVEEREIQEIRRVMESGFSVRPWPYLKAGDRVRVERGPLKGLEGALVKEKESMRLVVSVELLQRAISVELDPDMVRPLRALARCA